MSESTTATVKPFVRPKAGKGIQVGVRCPLAVLDEIDRWAAAQPDKPKRGEAILRLVQEALADTTDKQSTMSLGSPADASNSEEASHTAPTPTAAEPPQSEQLLGVEIERTTREVRWTPRVIEAGPLPVPQVQASPAVTNAPAPVMAMRKARPATKPIEDNKPYEMPEDVEVFNEFWKRAERRLRRRLNYEEAVVSYNRQRQSIAECD